jgi:protein-S-isoprenylcysteine O-methyltransferase Ste14
MKDLPGQVLALTVASYWTSVVMLAWLRRLRHRQRVGLLPAKPKERWMWTIWVPVILLWNVLPWVALSSYRAPWYLPAFVQAAPAFLGLRIGAAAGALACFLLTLHCWFKMGRSWSLAVVPQRTNTLVQSGMYGFVRHPIYALSMALMLCSLVVVPTLPMLTVAALHVTLLFLKTRSEEESLFAVHGQAYLDYTRRTGRFFPTLISLRQRCR